MNKLLRLLEICWSELRQFAFKNRTVFEVVFIFVYAFEQVLLIILTEMFSEDSIIIISLFAVIVLSTFAFHKLVMESRIRVLESQVAILQSEVLLMSKEVREIADRNAGKNEKYKNN